MNISQAKSIVEAEFKKLGIERRMVMVTMYVPLDEIDLSNCQLERYAEMTEMAGAKEYTTTVDYDLSDATYNGLTIERFSDDDEIVDHMIQEGF